MLQYSLDGEAVLTPKANRFFYSHPGFWHRGTFTTGHKFLKYRQISWMRQRKLCSLDGSLCGDLFTKNIKLRRRNGSLIPRGNQKLSPTLNRKRTFEKRIPDLKDVYIISTCWYPTMEEWNLISLNLKNFKEETEIAHMHSPKHC